MILNIEINLCECLGSSAVVQNIWLPKQESYFDQVFGEEGAFGEYQVLEFDGISVAVKIVPASETKEVLSEYDTLTAASECRYIVDLLGCVGASSVYFFIEQMSGNCHEYYKQLLTIRKSVSEEEVQCIAFSIASALKFLKDCEIMHRDVKPANILISDKGIVKLSDFGISRVLDRGCSNYTEIATKSYLPPERCRLVYELNNRDVPEQLVYEFTSDVWCFGVSLVEIANMCHPYYPESTENNATDWNRQLYFKLSQSGPELNGNNWSIEFKKLVEDCVRPDPTERPAYDQILSDYHFLSVIPRGGNDSGAFTSDQIARKVTLIRERQKEKIENLPP